MIADDATIDVQAAIPPARAPPPLRAAADTALRRELPLDSWLLFVEVRLGGLRVSGLARAGDTAEWVGRALQDGPGIGEVETDLLLVSNWQRTE